MLTAVIIAFVAALYLINKRVSLVKVLMSSAITLVCYIGVLMFVVLTFAHSMREHSNN